MKKANLVSTLTHLIKPAAAALLFIIVSAMPVNAATDKSKEPPVEFKYLGSVEGKPLFQISLNNPLGEELQLTLRDEDGYLIYSDTVKDTTYLRKLQFDALDTDRLKVTLTLRTKKSSQTQTFEISKSSRMVEDIAVATF